MKKIGITTRYYGSRNYGGLLQAYALCRYLKNRGYDAEQICCIREGGGARYTLRTVWKLPISQIFKKAYNFVHGKAVKIMTRLVVKKYNDRRFQATKTFREGIPHSEEVYNKKTVHVCKDKYDIFVTGSDRVWDANNTDSPMFLGFAGEKPKFSYAASIMASQLTTEQKTAMEECLRTYSAISVREREACELLKPIEAEWVVDPTMLLTSEQWDEVAGRRQVQEEYLFCYFLGTDTKPRRLAKAFAKKHGLKIVTIPYINEQFVLADVGFGDIQMGEAAVEDFVSLIKHAKYVFTDSFHSTVFSAIYQKECFSFIRKNKKNSGTRLESLTSMLGSEDHLCNIKERMSLKYIEDVCPIDYNAAACKLNNMRESSMAFLDKLSFVP